MRSSLMAILLLAAVPCHAVDQGVITRFLKQYIGFTEQDLAAFRGGQPVVRVLDTAEKSEVAAFGIVRVEVPQSYFLFRYRHIENFKSSSDAVLAVHKLSDSPTLEDFKDLTVDSEDLKSMRNCRVGDCNVKLPVSVIGRLQSEVRWTAPDHAEKVLAIAKETLLSYVRNYLSGGNEALVRYHDKKEARRLADEFHAILQQSRYLYDYAPELHRYLDNFPNEKLPGSESFLYWSKEKFGLKPVVSITHSTIYRDRRGGVDRAFIAAKQIYASHYFDASVALAAMIDDTQNPSKPAFYLMYLNRSRADALRGGFSGLKRAIIEKQSRGALLEVLKTGKSVLESDY